MWSSCVRDSPFLHLPFSWRILCPRMPAFRVEINPKTRLGNSNRYFNYEFQSDYNLLPNRCEINQCDTKWPLLVPFVVCKSTAPTRIRYQFSLLIRFWMMCEDCISFVKLFLVWQDRCSVKKGKYTFAWKIFRDNMYVHTYLINIKSLLKRLFIKQLPSLQSTIKRDHAQKFPWN